MGQESQAITFENIIEANKASIYRICRIYSVSPMEPKDLFQEIVFQIWKSYPSFKGGAKISTWIYRIALNVGMRYKLKLDKHNTNTTPLYAITIAPVFEIENNNQEEQFVALRTCIQMVKPADQTILILYLEELAYKEIADITGLSENHIAVKMKRIRKTLFDCITPKLK